MIWLLTKGKNTDIQLHDAYFLLDSTAVTTLLIAPITLITFLVISIRRKFYSLFANIGLAIGLSLVSIALLIILPALSH